MTDPVVLLSTGDVVGPAAITDGALVLFDGTSGKKIKGVNSVVTNQGLSLLDDVDATANRATIGLQNVNNTSDMDKPVSTLTQIELAKRVGRDAIITAGFSSGDVTYPYFQSDSTAIIRLATATQLSYKTDADWVSTVGLVSNNPSLPYVRQSSTNNIVLLVSNTALPRNTCQQGVPGWWKCADTGLIRQKVSLFLGDISTNYTGSVTWPMVFPTRIDTVKISLLQSSGSSATLSASYFNPTVSGCGIRADEWNAWVQSGLTIMIEAEGY